MVHSLLTLADPMSGTSSVGSTFKGNGYDISNGFNVGLLGGSILIAVIVLIYHAPNSAVDLRHANAKDHCPFNSCSPKRSFLHSLAIPGSLHG